MSRANSPLIYRAGRDGHGADLEAAIDAARRGTELRPRLAGLGAAMPLANLSVLLVARFELAGDLADLNAAITAAQEAVDLTPPGHPDLARHQSGLADARKNLPG